MFNISTWFNEISVIYVLMTGCRPLVLTALAPSSDFTAAHVPLVHLADEVTSPMTSSLSAV